MSTIGERIKEKRIEAGLTVDELAERIGRNRATVYRYENDFIKDMPLNAIGTIAIVLHTSPAYLMGWEEEKPVTNIDDGLAEVAKIFIPLSPDNRAKLIELGRLFLTAQNNSEERQ